MMSTATENKHQRAHALDLALRTPGIRNGADVLRLAAAYQAYIAGDEQVAGDAKPAVSAGCPNDQHVSAVSTNTELVTFDQFVQHGRDSTANLVAGMPWSFSFRGHPVTHENDRCYLIGVNAEQVRFTPDDVLVINPDGSLATIQAERPTPADPLADDSVDYDKP